MKIKFIFQNKNYIIKRFSSTFSVGILGYPNVGKSTFFNCLVRKEQAYSANFPFSTIEPNIATIKVEDSNIFKLCKMLENKTKIKPYEIKIVDIAGMIKDSSKNENTMRPAYDCNAFIQILRCFEDPKISYYESKINPKNEMDTVNMELVLSDMNVLQKRMNKKKKISSLDKELVEEMNKIDIFEIRKKWLVLMNDYKEFDTLIQKCLNVVNDTISSQHLKSKIINEILNYENLLIFKPKYYVLNSNNNEDLKKAQILGFNQNDYSFLSIQQERDLINLTEETDNVLDLYQNLKELNVEKLKSIEVLENLINKKMNFIRFYTVAGDNNIISSFLLKKNSSILDAAAKIHSDFAKNFICAEIYNIEDLLFSKGKKVGREFKLDENDFVIKFYKTN